MPAEAVTTTDSPASGPLGSEVNLWQRFAFHAVRTCLCGVMALLSLRGLYLLGRGFGTLEWLINYKRRRRFRSRLETILGDALTPRQRRLQARRFFMRTRCDKIFYLIFDRIPRDLLLARFKINDRELLDQVVQRGQGCLVAMSHYGTHHVAALLMVLCGYEVAGVRDPNEGGMRRFVRSLYARRYPEFGRMRMLSADAYPRDIYRCFQGNCVLGAALDIHRIRDERKRTARVRLFGQERGYLVGTVQIAARCGAGVLQGFVVSGKDFHYRLDLLGPLMEDPAAAESPERLQQAMQTYADNIADYLRKYPDHLSRV